MKTTLLARVLEVLEGRGARPALIGGMALAAHGVGRATQDFDILVLDAAVLSEKPWTALRESGVEIEIRRGDAADLVLLKLDAGGPQDRLDIRLLLRGPAGPALRTEVESRLAALPQPLRDAWTTLED